MKHRLDSKTALCRIENRGEWKQFVCHHVGEILKLTHKNDWGYKNTEYPADLGSRGTSQHDDNALTDGKVINAENVWVEEAQTELHE